MSLHLIDYLILWVKWKTSFESLSIYRPLCNEGPVGWFGTPGLWTEVTSYHMWVLLLLLLGIVVANAAFVKHSIMEA